LNEEKKNMAASTAVLTLRALRGGKTYTVHCYVPDAVSTNLTFNTAGTAGTGSPTSFRVPFDCIIYDISTAAAPTATVGTFLRNSGAITGGLYAWANQLNTLSNRQKMAIPLAAGDFLSVVQS